MRWPHDSAGNLAQTYGACGLLSWRGSGAGQKNRQSLAEAIAKHFKDEFAGHHE